MQLVKGQVYLINYKEKKVRAVYCYMGGSDGTGFDNHCFMLKRKQTFIVDGVPKSTKYAFIKDSELHKALEVK